MARICLPLRLCNGTVSLHWIGNPILYLDQPIIKASQFGVGVGVGVSQCIVGSRDRWEIPPFQCVPWYMMGSHIPVTFEVGIGENVPGFPCACATRNFTYLVRGPCSTLWVRSNNEAYMSWDVVETNITSWYFSWISPLWWVSTSCLPTNT